MAFRQKSSELDLTVDEAYALLELAMTSPVKLDPVSEAAIQKLARFCRKAEPESGRSPLGFAEVAG